MVQKMAKNSLSPPFEAARTMDTFSGKWMAIKWLTTNNYILNTCVYTKDRR